MSVNGKYFLFVDYYLKQNLDQTYANMNLSSVPVITLPLKIVKSSS